MKAITFNSNAEIIKVSLLLNHLIKYITNQAVPQRTLINLIVVLIDNGKHKGSIHYLIKT